MSTQTRTRGNILSNIDKTVTDAQVAEVEKIERAVDIMDAAKKDSSSRDGDFFDVYESHEDQKATNVTKAYLDKMKRELGREPSIKPLRMTVGVAESPFGFAWTLTQQDADAVDAGYYCNHCLTLQDDPNGAQCRWKHDPYRIGGCGFNRISMSFIKDGK